MKTAVEPLLAQLDSEPKPTIGFHIRGGDKFSEDILGCGMGIDAQTPEIQAQHTPLASSARQVAACHSTAELAKDLGIPISVLSAVELGPDCQRT